MSVLTENTNLSLKMAAHFNEAKEQLASGSPEILNAPRKPAFQEFILKGIPTPSDENYKYTNLQPSFLPDFSFSHQKEELKINLNDVFKCDVPQLDTHLVILHNGWFYEGESISGPLPAGVILCSLQKAAQLYPELVSEYYTIIANPADDPMVALNTAFAKDGYFLYVPKNTDFGKPIQILNLLRSENDSYITQRNLIIAGDGSKVKLIVCDHTLDTKKHLFNSVTEAVAGENASVDYYTVQNQHNNSTSINSVYFRQNKNSTLRTNTATLHGGLIRNNLKVVLNGENARAHLFGMAFTDRKQHVDNFTQIIHAKPHCESNQLYKNVLDGESTGAFSGRIHVARDAQKTNAFQRNNNLLLTDSARMQAKPQLIIDADDVKCSHGATVGQIDREALFYLRSRGINRDEAMMMMMNAFAHEVIQEITIEPLRNRIDELVEKRLRGEISRCHDCAYNCEC